MINLSNIILKGETYWSVNLLLLLPIKWKSMHIMEKAYGREASVSVILLRNVYNLTSMQVIITGQLVRLATVLAYLTL